MKLYFPSQDGNRAQKHFPLSIVWASFSGSTPGISTFGGRGMAENLGKCGMFAATAIFDGLLSQGMTL
jgi:hypothetical protein